MDDTNHKNIQSLFKEFEDQIPLTSEESNLIKSKITAHAIKKKTLILKDGKICKHYTYINKGCFKMFGIDDKGFSHNIQFAAEGNWIADVGSFYTQLPSNLNIEAIEDAEIFQIPQADLYELFVQIPKLNRMFKVTIENNFVELQNRVIQNFSSTAVQRYNSFLKHYPFLSNRLPNKEIASYLGITPEFLSKIRKEMSSPNRIS
ncbi:MAG: Crp/Fnr family transcriptional regulator [Cytophagaceae bacterium]|nr:Crp/Fnr family transcriptional regulator [Cytophagaceae bacterium]MBK9934268.1 Crp/Fnr family transcriptional regulator [Cytophagaceae bacterium]MBL0300720.1 Crp/Fnr family transcriptional regulator [Cytophagaceae bacterium]MBL0327662.1 Crp/Fnr family transcriptional regulator [Cytophagaceae bacterium]